MPEVSSSRGEEEQRMNERTIRPSLEENTERTNTEHDQAVLQRTAHNWQESFYQYYFRANRVYKHITYYAWRFAELHSFKVVLLMMVLVSTLKVKEQGKRSSLVTL